MWEIWDGKRNTFFSPSRIVTFLPVQKSFVPAVPKCEVFREGCDKKSHKLKKYFHMRERHILPRNVTNVTRHIFCHRKKWQTWRHSLKSETGSWKEIRLGPTLTQNNSFWGNGTNQTKVLWVSKDRLLVSGADEGTGIWQILRLQKMRGKIAIDLIDLLRFFAIFSSEIKLDTGKRLKRTVKIYYLQWFDSGDTRFFLWKVSSISTMFSSGSSLGVHVMGSTISSNSWLLESHMVSVKKLPISLVNLFMRRKLT